MEPFSKEYREALQAIESAQLPEIERSDLRVFISSSLDPDHAARYTLQRISQSSGCSTAEEALQSLRTDLITIATKMFREEEVPTDMVAALNERDGVSCCITGSPDVIATYIINPSIVKDKDLQPGGYLRPLLEASITKEKTEQMLTLLGQRSLESKLRNLWIMTPGARELFLHGRFGIIKSPDIESGGSVTEESWRIRRTTPGEISPDLLGGDDTLVRIPSTENEDTHPLPAELLLRIHGIISVHLHFCAIENQIKAGWPPVKQEPTAVGLLGRFLLHIILLLLPIFVRRSLYNFVNQLIEDRNPRQKGSCIKFLPLGLCLKRGKHTANEANALLLTKKYTSINAPRLIDSVTIDGESGFILMTRILGDQLSDVFYRTTSEEREQIGKDLAKWVAQLRRIPNKTNYLIADTLGGPVSDECFPGETCGPFNTITDFTDRLIRGAAEPRDGQPLSLLYEKKHEVYFTHSSLHMENLFVQRGQLSGIIGWENAGFKPEYWECTRALRHGESAGQIYRGAFGDKYEEEMKAGTYISA